VIAPPRSPVRQRGPLGLGELRLDGLENPFAPTPLARQALAAGAELCAGPERSAAILAARLGRWLQVSPESIVLAPSIEDLAVAVEGLREVVAVAPHHPLTPGDPQPDAISPGAVVRIQSPADPTGALVRLQPAVRLATSARLLMIDERHAGYAPRDHLPLFREFDRVVLLRSFEHFCGLTEQSVAFALAHGREADRLRTCFALDELDPLALEAAIATLEDESWLAASARRVAAQRMTLVRALRKLNMVRPFPSAAAFVSARIERGDREALREFLDQRGIAVHYPNAPGLERVIRISAVSSRATRSLVDALIAWGREI
jgi:histidinol-phosphate/aromatic aminotransferase/cobyric acid decarboxylase-like protein